MRFPRGSARFRGRSDTPRKVPGRPAGHHAPPRGRPEWCMLGGRLPRGCVRREARHVSPRGWLAWWWTRPWWSRFRSRVTAWSARWWEAVRLGALSKCQQSLAGDLLGRRAGPRPVAAADGERTHLQVVTTSIWAGETWLFFLVRICVFV